MPTYKAIITIRATIERKVTMSNEQVVSDFMTRYVSNIKAALRADKINCQVKWREVPGNE